MRTYSALDLDAALDSEVDASSELLSLPTQHPDIRNWFSSYESLPLDDSGNFDGCVFEAIDGDNEGFQHQDVGEVEVAETKTPGEFGNLTNRAGDEQVLRALTLRKCDSVAFVSEETPVAPAANLPNKLNGEVNWVSPKMVESAVKVPEELPAQCATRSGSGEEKHLDGRASREKNGSLAPKKNCVVSPRKPLTIRNIKEDAEVSTGKDGFISTKSKENGKIIGVDVSILRENRKDFLFQKQHQEGTIYGGRHAQLSGKDQVQLQRIVLKETPDAFVEGGLTETPGKWLCPQKNKPHVGPPLKQLRLERWVHRMR